jgi:hypothetical protein
MKLVTLTEEQAKVVIQALDAVVKQGGLNTAVVVLPIATAIENQLVDQPS